MTNSKIKHFVVIITLCCAFGCKQEKGQLIEIEGKQIPVDTSLTPVDSLTAFIAPYKKRVDEVLDSTLAHAPRSLDKSDGERNTSMGNFLADLIFEETAPLFKTKTGKELDFVIMNHGGIRAILSAGPVTARNAYEIMPFENYISVVELDGTAVRNLVLFLVGSRRAHAISGMQIVMDKDGGLESITIGDSPFDESRSYFVATSDYLVAGGSEIGFFPDVKSVTDTGYLLRNAIIDHFRKKDTLTGQVDDRFIVKD